jgi:N-acetylornithine carbamoyltransferase
MAGPTAGPTAAEGAPGSFLSLRTLPASDWESLLEHAETLSGPRGREPLLARRRFAAVFLQPSLRTRTAFEVASFDLGAHAVVLQAGGGMWALEHRDGVVMDGEAAEHVKEGIGVLARMVDGLGVRTFAGLRDADDDARDPVIRAVAAASRVPVLNLESATDHPHQGLADAFTLRRRFGRSRARVVVAWAPHVKALPMAVPNAACLAFAREGHEVVCARPERFGLDPAVVADVRRLARAAGGSFEETADREAAMRGARAVYVKAWGSRAGYGDPDAAAAARREHAAWTVTEASLRGTDGAIVLHCLPVRRNVVIADEVLDGPRSVVLEQGEARLHVQKATLCRAVGVAP